ncbi:MAG: hypothetical protein HYZ74_03795 [Elusimicrobia bacterium]|nr:hypothetical protein [Elusimicrobiota bacterium]
MSALVLCVVFGAIPVAWYLWRAHTVNTPSLRWPVLAKILNLKYESGPARMAGVWNGRKVAFEAGAGSVTVSAWLNAPTRLRVECGAKDVVAGRAGMLVPDAVEPRDAGFRDRLLARCSDKAAGAVVFDVTLQQRLAALAAVDFIGEQQRVAWTVPAVRDIDEAEALLGALCAVSDGLESFPHSGGLNAQANRP